MFGSGWQTRLARFLGVNTRTVRRWALGEYPVPAWVLDKLKIPAGYPETDTPEWIVGCSAGYGDREWLIHTTAPQFVAEVVDIYDWVSGWSYDLGNGDQLCRFQWTSSRPEPAELSKLMAAARSALEAIEGDE